MPRPVPERALRSLVAQLARERPEEIEAVLAQLDETGRVRVRSLLDAYDGQAARTPAAPAPAVPPAATPPAKTGHLEGVSPWLAARIAASAGAGPRLQPSRRRRTPAPQAPDLEFRMTDRALETLQIVATRLAPPPTLVLAAPKPTSRPWRNLALMLRGGR